MKKHFYLLLAGIIVGGGFVFVGALANVLEAATAKPLMGVGLALQAIAVIGFVVLLARKKDSG